MRAVLAVLVVMSLLPGCGLFETAEVRVEEVVPGAVAPDCGEIVVVRGRVRGTASTSAVFRFRRNGEDMAWGDHYPVRGPGEEGDLVEHIEERVVRFDPGWLRPDPLGFRCTIAEESLNDGAVWSVYATYHGGSGRSQGGPLGRVLLPNDGATLTVRERAYPWAGTPEIGASVDLVTVEYEAGGKVDVYEFSVEFEGFDE